MYALKLPILVLENTLLGIALSLFTLGMADWYFYSNRHHLNAKISNI